MAELSRPDAKGKAAGEAVDKAAIDALRPILTDNYEALGALYDDPKKNTDFPSTVELPDSIADSKVLDELAQEIAQGKSDRAKRLLAIMKSFKGLSSETKKQLELLENLSKIHAAAVKAVTENTGDFEFLGGSTLWNAISGFFKWLGNAIASLFSDKYKYKGLHEYIAEGAVESTVGSFAENLRANGLDPATPVGKQAVEQFQKAVRKEAKLDTPDATTDPARTPVAALIRDLRLPGGLKIQGDERLPLLTTPVNPMEAPERQFS